MGALVGVYVCNAISERGVGISSFEKAEERRLYDAAACCCGLEGEIYI